MKTLQLILLSLFINQKVFAQSDCRIRYSYDNAGQRVKRFYYCVPDGPGSTQTEVRISVFPNPTPGPIKVFTDKYGYLNVTALRMNGQVIGSLSCDECNFLTYNLSSEPPGTYIIEVLFQEMGLPAVEKSFTIVKI